MKKIPLQFSSLRAAITLCLFISFGISKVSAFDVKPMQIDSLPNVFMIGENESEYERMMTGCNTLLLSICKDDMELAYRKWLGLLSEMEKYADTKEIDIRGVKIWINVFWNTDGSIKHLVYYPKPNSKNMDFDKLSVFFAEFAQEYKMEFSSIEKCFSHFGSATFPTFADIYLGKTN